MDSRTSYNHSGMIFLTNTWMFDRKASLHSKVANINELKHWRRLWLLKTGRFHYLREYIQQPEVITISLPSFEELQEVIGEENKKIEMPGQLKSPSVWQ